MSATLADSPPRRSFSGTAGELGEGILRVVTTGQKNDGKLEVYLGHTQLDTLTLRQGIIPLDVSGVSDVALNRIARRVYQLFQEEIASRTRTYHALSGFTGRLVTAPSSQQVVRHTQYEGANEQAIAKSRRHADNRVTPEDRAMTEIYQLVMASQGRAYLEDQRGVGYFDPYAVDESGFDELGEFSEGVAVATQTSASQSKDEGDSSGRAGSSVEGSRRRNARGLASRKVRVHRTRYSGTSEARGVAAATQRLGDGEAATALTRAHGLRYIDEGAATAKPLHRDGEADDPTRSSFGFHHGDDEAGVRTAATLYDDDSRLGGSDSSGEDAVRAPMRSRPPVPRLQLTGSALDTTEQGAPRALAMRSTGVQATPSPTGLALHGSWHKLAGDGSDARLDSHAPGRASSATDGAIPSVAMVSESTQYDLEELAADSLPDSALRTRLSAIDRATGATRNVLTETLHDGVTGDGVVRGAATERGAGFSPRSSGGSTITRHARRVLDFGLNTSTSTRTSSTESSPRGVADRAAGEINHAVRQAMVERLGDDVFGDSIYVSEGPFQLEEIPSAIREGRLEVLCLKGSAIAPYIQHVARDHILCRALRAIRKEEEASSEIPEADLRKAIMRLMVFMANYDPSTVAFARDWFLQCAAQTNMHYSLEGKLVLAAVSNEPGHPNKEWLCEIEIQKVLARLKDPKHPEMFSIGQLMTAWPYTSFESKRQSRSPERSPSPTHRVRTPLPLSRSPVRGVPRIQISPSPVPSASSPIRGGVVNPEPAARRSASPLDADALHLVQEEVTLARQQANAICSGLRLSTNSTTSVPPESSLDEVAARYGNSRGVFEPVMQAGTMDVSRLVADANDRFLDIHHHQLNVQRLVGKLAQTYPLDRFNQVVHQSPRALSVGPRSFTFEQSVNQSQSALVEVEALHQKILQLLNKHLKEVGFADEGAPHLIKYVRKHGALPATLEHRLSIRQESLKWQVAQLVYLAIAFRKEPRSLTFKPATFQELQWMFQGDAESNTRRLLSFIKTVAEEIGHSTLSVQQAKWGACFQSLFNGQAKEHQEIYAEAGSGKTTAVNFFLKDFHRQFPEKRVIYLSPLPKAEDPDRSDWLQFIQLDPGASVNSIQLPDGWSRENLIVIVDEAHCLKPGEDLLVREAEQCYRVPQYLRITATPISCPMKMQGAYQATEASLRDQIERCEAVSQQVNERLLALDQKAAQAKRAALLRYLLKTVKRAGSPPLAWLPSSFPPLDQYGYARWYQGCLEKQEDLDQLALHFAEGFGKHRSSVFSNQFFRTSIEGALGRILGTRSFDYERWSSALAYVFGSKEDAVVAYRSSYLSAPIQEVFGDLVNPSADHEMEKKKLEALLQALIQSKQKLQEKLLVAERKSQDPQIAEAVTKYEEEQVKRCVLLGRRVNELSPHKALGVEHHQRVRTLRHQMQVHQQPAPYREGLNAEAIEMLIQQLETVSVYRRVQMILPGVALTQQDVRLLAERVAPRKVLFLCSEPGVNFGKKLVFDEGAFYELADERVADQDSLLMLYDDYTKQGGDFGKLSLSSSGQKIMQLIFLNLAAAGHQLPSELMSEVDLCQALYRARGAFADSRVYCLEDRAMLLRRLEEKQKQRERLVAKSDVACAMVNRILEAQRAVQEALEKAHSQGHLRAVLVDLQRVIHLDEAITSERVHQMVQASFDLLQKIFTSLDTPFQENAEEPEALTEIYQQMVDASCLLQEAERLLKENQEALEAVEAARVS